MPVSDFVRRSPVLAFFFLTYLFSWIFWIPLQAIPGTVPPGGDDTLLWLGVVIMYLGGFGPLVAAAVVVRIGDGDLRTWAGQIVHWRVAPRWWLAALGLPIIAIILVSALYIGLGGPYDFGQVTPVLLYIPLLLFTVVLSGGLNEEPGWRGLATPLLQERYSAFMASLVVGIVWALWHLPLFFAPIAPHSDFPLLGQLLYFPTVVVWSILITWVYNGSASVLMAMLLHAGMNVSGGWIPLDVDAIIVDGIVQAELVGMISGFTFVVYLAIAIVVIAVFSRRSLARGTVPTGADIGFDSPGDRSG